MFEFLPAIDLEDGPKHPDGCSHDKDCYLGSFSLLRDNDVVYYDVYVFEENGKQEVCIRFGDEDSEYISPGTIINVIEHAHADPVYHKAAELILWRGKFTWTKYQNQPEVPKE